METKITSILTGVLIGAVITAGTAFAINQTIQKDLSYQDIKITLNGNEVIPTDASGNVVEPFIIDGTTYLPVRAIANAVGLSVDWDGSTNTVHLSDSTAGQQISDEELNAFLSGNKDFIEVSTRERATIHTLPEINPMCESHAIKYLKFDLDSDGFEELILQYANGEYAVLKKRNNEWYSYYVPMRGLLALKTDGTATGSNGAADGSIHKLIFTENKVEYQNIVKYDANANFFAINGKLATPEECQAMIDIQNRKEAVQFIDIN